MLERSDAEPKPRRPGTAAAATAPIRLEAPGGLASSAMLASLAAHTVPGAERTDPTTGTHERLVHTAQGAVAVSVRLDDHGVDLTVHASPDVMAAVVPAVRSWLDLSTDLGAVRTALRADPLLRPLVDARPALRVTGTTDVFQTAVTTVLGQQVSLAAGRTFAGRLVAAYGQPGPHRFTQFPTAAVLAEVRPEELQAAVGLTSSRARTVRALAEAFADRGHSPGDAGLRLTRDELLAVHGVGPWTADYLEVRTGSRDAFAPGDLVLRRALGGISPAEAARRAEAWRPFRAYALVHLWTATAYAP